MKKFSRVIAMALVLLMLACSFTSCLSYVYRSAAPLKRVVFAVVDIVFLPISLIALLVYIIITDASGDMDSQVYMASADDSIFSEYYSLAGKINSLSEEELASLRETLNSLPEADRISSMEKISALSDEKRISLVSAYASLPDTEYLSALERISALSEEELVALLQSFNVLSDEELDSIIEELSALYQTQYVARFPREEDYTGLSLQ